MWDLVALRSSAESAARSQAGERCLQGAVGQVSVDLVDLHQVWASCLLSSSPGSLLILGPRVQDFDMSHNLGAVACLHQGWEVALCQSQCPKFIRRKHQVTLWKVKHISIHLQQHTVGFISLQDVRHTTRLATLHLSMLRPLRARSCSHKVDSNRAALSSCYLTPLR